MYIEEIPTDAALTLLDELRRVTLAQRTAVAHGAPAGLVAVASPSELVEAIQNAGLSTDVVLFAQGFFARFQLREGDLVNLVWEEFSPALIAAFDNSWSLTITGGPTHLVGLL